VGRCGFVRESVAQIGFQLDGENSFLRHGTASLVITLTIPCQYVNSLLDRFDILPGTKDSAGKKRVKSSAKGR
jgi:hypothetical protein